MSFIKRAALYCLRQRFKTMILFLVLTVIAAFMLTGIALRNAAEGATANVRTAVGGKIILDIDTEGHMGGLEQYEWGTAYTYTGDQITQDIVDAIKNVEGVKDYNVEEAESYFGAGVNFKYLPAAFDLSYTPYGEASSYTITLSSEKCKAFQSGKYKLAAGRHITPEDKYVCLISKELADYNKLSVEDKIQMYSLDSDSISEFKIIGIFDGAEGSSGNTYTVSDIPANLGYMDYAGWRDIFKDMGDTDYQHLTVFVDDPLDIQNVYNKISALPEIKGKTLKLSIDTDEYDIVSAPLDSLENLVNTTIIIISAVSVVILTLLLTIRIRGRKNEIGILLSVGKSKGNIILQIFAEIFAVAVISFASAVPLSCLTAEKAGEFLVSKVTEGTAEAANLNVRIEAAYLLPLFIIGLILIAAAVIASSWIIVRCKPKAVLTKIS